MISKLLSSFLYFIAYLLLFIGYKFLIVPVYGYYGFIWKPNSFKIVESAILILLTAFFLPTHFRKPSDILIHLQYLFPVLPMLMLYGAQDQPRSYLYMSVAAFWVVLLLVRKVRTKAIRAGVVLSPRLYHRFLLLMGWGVIAVIILLGGLRYFNLNLLKVYEFRSAAAGNLPGIFGYILPMTAKVIFPFSLLIALVRKEKLLAALSLAGSVMMFGLTAHKGSLFYPFAVLTLYGAVRSRYAIGLLLTGYSAVTAVSVLLYTLIGHSLFGSLMLRRTFLVPAYLNFIYFDFFSKHSFALWAQSKITFRLIDYNYSLDTPHLIGYHYFGRAACGANTGWLGSGYANAGFLGMFLCAILVGLFLAFLDSYGKIIDKKLIVALVMAPLLSVFMSSDFFTAFLTHGSFLALLLLLFFPSSISNVRLRTCM